MVLACGLSRGCYFTNCLYFLLFLSFCSFDYLITIVFFFFFLSFFFFLFQLITIAFIFLFSSFSFHCFFTSLLYFLFGSTNFISAFGNFTVLQLTALFPSEEEAARSAAADAARVQADLEAEQEAELAAQKLLAKPEVASALAAVASSADEETNQPDGWYYMDKYRKKQGPVTVEALMGVYKKFEINDTTLCWQPGQSGWKVISNDEKQILFT